MICIASLTTRQPISEQNVLQIGGLDHDVLVVAVEHPGGHVEHRVHGVGQRGHVGDRCLTSSKSPAGAELVAVWPT
jgi:hypothetical protein